MNWVKRNRVELEKDNYVVKADASTKYWFGLSENKLKKYRVQTNGQFNIIIYGDDQVNTDFYTVPYNLVKEILIPDNLYKFNDRTRWVGDINNHILRFRIANTAQDVLSYYGRLVNELQDPSFNEIDYSIENARREIAVRQKQSVFRKRVLDNFNHRCCLTGVSEQELLVASHIIPWSSKVETRLDPANGLCLSVLYDKLFDSGYFTLDDNLKVQIPVKRFDSIIDDWLERINGQKISSPSECDISRTALEYHSTEIFMG